MRHFLPFREVRDEIDAALKSDQAMQRYWAAMVCTRFGSSARSMVNETMDPLFAVEVLNSVIWFKDHFQGKHPVLVSDLHPLCRGGDLDDRLNYIRGMPYPPETKRKKKNKK